MFRHQLDEARIGLVHSDAAALEPVFAEHRGKNRVDESVDERTLFDDGDCMNFLDPGHCALGTVAFPAGTKKDGRLIRD